MHKPDAFGGDRGLEVIDRLINDPGNVAKVNGLAWWLADLSGGKHDLLIGDDPLIIKPPLDADEVLLALPLAPRLAFLATRAQRGADILIRRGQSRSLE